jgi:hypothetical protein
MEYSSMGTKLLEYSDKVINFNIDLINSNNFLDSYNSFFINHNNKNLFIHTIYFSYTNQHNMLYHEYSLNECKGKYFTTSKKVTTNINMIDVINSSNTLLEVRDKLKTLILFS